MERRTVAAVPYSADQMFSLIADVKKYPEFLPWCIALRVVAESDDEILADMVVAYKVFREKFRSRTVLHRDESVIDSYFVDGPFRKLHSRWRFEPRPDGDCVINFSISFEFKSLILQSAAVAVFEKAFARMTEAFVKRADDMYGVETMTRDTVNRD
ncbi:MAG: type II toxin-antitoxin system RatA family toxin [Marinicaulis sp.]|nr:type II toxin-antitoxin system RatA family toxin [Marinicaulis sp.]